MNKCIKTSAGKITTRLYGGDIKGAEILLDGIITVVFKVSKEGETCVLVTTHESIERIEID